MLFRHFNNNQTLEHFSFSGFVLFDTRFGALSHSFSAGDADAGVG